MKVPAKEVNTTLCAAIDNKGPVAYQIFDQGMHSEDYLGFISNLVNCLKLRRNTSLDEMKLHKQKIGTQKSGVEDQRQNQEKTMANKEVERVDSYSVAGQKGIVLIMDNASIH